MRDMLQQTVQHKSTITDGTVVVIGGVYSWISESLPIVIGVLTALLLIGRLYLVYQEAKINKIKLEKKDDS